MNPFGLIMNQGLFQALTNTSTDFALTSLGSSFYHSPSCAGEERESLGFERMWLAQEGRLLASVLCCSLCRWMVCHLICK